jgi:hypothetical protein
MNFSHNRCYQPPSVRVVGQSQRIIHYMRSLLCLVLCLLGIPASAQNLLVNGDFEAGQLAPWSGGELRSNPSGGVLARIGDPMIGDTIAQTVTTVPGKRYLLSAELRHENEFGVEVVMSAQTPAGNFDARRGVGVVGMAPQRFNVPFTASSTSAFISFVVTVPFDPILIDNVSLIAVAPSAADGSYAGTIVTKLAVTDPAMHMKSSRKVTARINDDGEIILLDGTDGIITGYILNSGEFSLDLPGGKTVTGTAIIRSRRIELEYITGSHDAVTASGGTVANTIKQTLMLVRQ